MANRRQKLVNREFENSIYAAGLHTGIPVLLVVPTSVFDPNTGQNTMVYAEHKVPLANTYLVSETERFAYDIGYLAANKNFTHSGEYQIGDRHMFITGRYLPNLPTSVEDFFIVINSDHFNVLKKATLGTSVYFHLRNTDGQRYLEAVKMSEVIAVSDGYES